MRFVPTSCLREGMQLGKSLYNEKGNVLLNHKAQLRSSYIDRIKELGYNGIYVDDEVSKEIELQEMISETLRSQTVNTVKNTFVNIEKDKGVTQETRNQISNLINNIVDEILSNSNLMVNMMDLKVFDDYTYYHSVNVTVLSIVMGVARGYNKDQLTKLGLGALLHDIGKVFTPKEILNKPGKLEGKELEIMKNHSFEGYKYLKEHFQLPTVSYVSVLQHHERYDGGGYPKQMKKDAITEFSRIISIADVYDALTSDRPYRKAMSPSEAMEYIMGNSGTMFDPDIVNIFVRKVAPYPIGTIVLLSNGLKGIVVQNFENFGMRPLIKVLNDDSSNIIYLNLKSDSSTMGLTIIDIVKE